MQHLQNKIKEEIGKLSSEFSIPPAELYEPARYMLDLGGKRIRPLFVLLACDLFNGKIEDAMDAALSTELFHNFTLVHDDIMDNAPLRRNQPTVHQKWNTSTAILSGDVMLVKAYQLICKSKMAETILPIFNTMAAKVCEGQQWDLNYEQLHKISIAHYFKMIELKTAVLIAACLQIGARIGGASEADAKNLYEFGKNIGLAFQLQDDLLDVYGNEEKFGKQRGGDIISNKKTFLLLKTMDIVSASTYKKEELQQWLSIQPTNENDIKEKIAAVKNIYDFAHVKEITEQEIRLHHHKAIRSLDSISVSKEKKESLINFTTSLLNREA